MAEQLYYGPLWPLGHITPAYRGAGEALTHELTGRIETTEYFEAAAMALIITPVKRSGGAYANNSGYIFLCVKSSAGTFDAANFPETVVMALSPTSGPQQIPQAEYGSNRYKLDELGIDIDVDGDGAFVCGIMQ